MYDCGMRIWFLFVLSVLVGFGQKQAEVDRIFAAFNTHTPGCAVGVSKNGKLELATGYGMADLERQVAIGPGTIFESGSLAKQFTAATLMLLEQQGKLSLDDAMGKYLPELQGATARVTIRQVISHISGIREWRPIATMGGRQEGTYVYTNEDLLEMAGRQKALNFDAGSQYSYSNTGYNIAVILVERVLGGKSFEEYTKEQIFAPLGMEMTSWRSRFRRIVPGRALAYGMGEGGVLEQATPIENIIGAGGMLTTVGDLLKWNENFVHARVGGAGMVAAQQKPAVLTGGKVIEYAAGLTVGEKEISHSGATGGYRTWLGRYPAAGVSVAVMCNSAQANAVQLGRRTAMLWTGGKEESREAGKRMEGMFRNLRDNTVVRGGRFVEAEGGRVKQVTPNGDVLFEKVEEWKSTGKELAELIGEYESEETASRVVIGAGVKEGELLLRVGATKLVLRPTFRDGFAGGAMSVVFRRDEAGKVVGMSVGDSRVWDLRFKRR